MAGGLAAWHRVAVVNSGVSGPASQERPTDDAYPSSNSLELQHHNTHPQISTLPLINTSAAFSTVFASSISTFPYQTNRVTKQATAFYVDRELEEFW